MAKKHQRAEAALACLEEVDQHIARAAAAIAWAAVHVPQLDNASRVVANKLQKVLPNVAGMREFLKKSPSVRAGTRNTSTK